MIFWKLVSEMGQSSKAETGIKEDLILNIYLHFN